MDNLTHPTIKIGDVYRYSNLGYKYDFEVVGFFLGKEFKARVHAQLRPLGEPPSWLEPGGLTYENCDNLVNSLHYSLLSRGDLFLIET